MALRRALRAAVREARTTLDADGSGAPNRRLRDALREVARVARDEGAPPHALLDALETSLEEVLDGDAARRERLRGALAGMLLRAHTDADHR